LLRRTGSSIKEYRMSEFVTPAVRWGVSIAAACLVIAGCSTRHKKTADELGSHDAAPALAEYSAPLDLRDFHVESTEAGERGVFLHLSRLPSAVHSTSQDNPPRIVVDIQGPTGGETPEEVFPGGDTMVTHVGISRSTGNLRVVLDLEGGEMPEFGVYPMADWVVVRIRPTNLRPRPWAHRAS
jgi:hypothetical protein